jgi:glucose-1-phosphate cytidylyltransferase
MKVVILAGGLGTRLSEETVLKPKPMVEIGGMPILWHIMKIYSSYGFNDFVICLGYKGYLIKEFFSNYFLHKSDITVDLKNNKVIFNESDAEPWTITLVDTGVNSMTGGRIKRIQKHIGNEPFFLTYGDGLSDVNIAELLEAGIGKSFLEKLIDTGREKAIESLSSTGFPGVTNNEDNKNKILKQVEEIRKDLPNILEMNPTGQIESGIDRITKKITKAKTANEQRISIDDVPVRDPLLQGPNGPIRWVYENRK